MRGIILVRAVQEQAGAVADTFNYFAVNAFRNGGASQAAANIALRFGQGFIYVIGAVHYNAPAKGVVVDAGFFTFQPE